MPEDYDDIPFDEFDDNEPENKVVLNDAEFMESNLPARRLWGVLTLKLREKKHVTLHTACGEIRDVVRVGDKITAFVYEEYLYNILTNVENFDKILLELKAIDAKITLEFILKQTGKTKNKLNLGQLQNLFGDALRFN